MVRLLQSALIREDDLRRKYREELHANELVLLAYYIAAIHIEEAFHGRIGDDHAYEPFGGIVLTDTFNLHTERTGFPKNRPPPGSRPDSGSRRCEAMASVTKRPRDKWICGRVARTVTRLRREARGDADSLIDVALGAICILHDGSRTRCPDCARSRPGPSRGSPIAKGLDEADLDAMLANRAIGEVICDG